MAVIDPNLFSEDVDSSNFQEEFKKYWNSPGDFKSPKFEIISKPFKICKIPNFLQSEEFLENLKDELSKHEFNRLHTDLYQFERTDDLVNMSGDCIPLLYKSFQIMLTSWMECNTGIKLNGKISMSSARYHDTNHLLCHDDNMGDRRIAYILYLSKDWTEQNGGTLDLFDIDHYGAPNKVVRSLVPEYNSLVFFEVVNNSYHQVGEVTTDAKCRWSINGWFHGPIENDYQKQSRYGMAKNLLQPSVNEMKLNSWISERYLLPRMTKQIQKSVEEMSYVFLANFLNESTYQQIANELTSQDINWQMIGPADICHYEVADEKTLPEPLKEFCDLFKSISFFQLLKNCTGLDLMPEDTSANSRSPKMRLELQRWSAGCYTLLYDSTMLEDPRDKVHADVADESINADNEFVLSTAQLGDTTASMSPSTAKDKTIQSEAQLNRKRTSLSPEKSPSGEKKRARHPNTQSDADQKCPSEKIRRVDETSLSHATKSDRLAVESTSATASSLHKSETISCDGKADVTADVVSDSEEDEESTLVVYDDDNSNDNDEESSISTRDGYVLDMIIQFHTTDAHGTPKTKDTINYVNPWEEQGIIIQVPQKDNHLCLAYKQPTVCRLQHYLNHFYDGYTYTLLCTYHE